MELLEAKIELLAKEQKVAEIEAKIQKDRLSDRRPSPPSSTEEPIENSSVEDREFLKIMDNNIYRDESGQWVASLPFREPRPRRGNNRQSALKRANM